jgi:hypothetical protein
MRGRPPRLRDGLCLRAVYWSYIEPKHQELTVDLRMPIMGFACSPPGSDHADHDRCSVALRDSEICST